MKHRKNKQALKKSGGEAPRLVRLGKWIEVYDPKAPNLNVDTFEDLTTKAVEIETVSTNK